jgi:hypothetical protein
MYFHTIEKKHWSFNRAVKSKNKHAHHAYTKEQMKDLFTNCEADKTDDGT